MFKVMPLYLETGAFRGADKKSQGEEPRGRFPWLFVLETGKIEIVARLGFGLKDNIMVQAGMINKFK